MLMTLTARTRHLLFPFLVHQENLFQFFILIFDVPNTFLMLHTPTVQAYACHNLLYILFRVSLVIEFLFLGGQNIQTQKVNYCIL